MNLGSIELANPFTAYPKTWRPLIITMKQNRTYLQAVFDREKPNIEKKEKGAPRSAIAAAAAFMLPKPRTSNDITAEQICRICGPG